VIPLLLAGLGALAGYAVESEVGRFERLAASELASHLQGDEKSVKVKADIDGIFGGASGRLHDVSILASDFSVSGLPLFTEPDRAQTGYIRTLRLSLLNFNLRALGVEELSATIVDCRYDFGLARKEGKIRLSKSGVGPGYVRMNATALERFILHKYREIKTVSVKLENDKVYVEGKGDFLLFSTEFYVSARLVPKNGVELWLEDAWMLLDGRLPLDGSGRILLDSLNPILDIDADLRLFGAFHISELKSRNGLLELWGEARIPNDPRR